VAKFVCHNLSCLIHAMEEFGIDANFGATWLGYLQPTT
jgi:hypothetical protein